MSRIKGLAYTSYEYIDFISDGLKHDVNLFVLVLQHELLTFIYIFLVKTYTVFAPFFLKSAFWKPFAGHGHT